MSASQPTQRVHPADNREEAADVVVLRGDLAWMHVGGVLYLLESEELSGWLSVPDGQVVVVDGQYAEARHGGSEGVDAMVSILGLEEGTFAFVEGTPDASPRQALSSVMVRCGQALDDWWRLSSRVIEVDRSVVGDHPVLKLLDGTRTLSEAVLEAGASFVDAVEALVDVLDDGHAEIYQTQEFSLVDLRAFAAALED
jgi:hypothetical protein